MVNCAYFVIQLLIQPSMYPSDTFCVCYRHNEGGHEEVFNYKMFESKYTLSHFWTFLDHSRFKMVVNSEQFVK